MGNENGLTVERVRGLREHFVREAAAPQSHDIDPHYSESLLALCDAWLAAQEPNGADARDAARYRWLRDEAGVGDVAWLEFSALDAGRSMDDLIDAAMAPPNTREGEAP